MSTTEIKPVAIEMRNLYLPELIEERHIDECIKKLAKIKATECPFTKKQESIIIDNAAILNYRWQSLNGYLAAGIPSFSSGFGNLFGPCVSTASLVASYTSPSLWLSILFAGTASCTGNVCGYREGIKQSNTLSTAKDKIQDVTKSIKKMYKAIALKFFQNYLAAYKSNSVKARKYEKYAAQVEKNWQNISSAIDRYFEPLNIYSDGTKKSSDFLSYLEEVISRMNSIKLGVTPTKNSKIILPQVALTESIFFNSK